MPPEASKHRIGNVRKRMNKELGIERVNTDKLAPQLEKEYAAAVTYNQYRRVENERQLEDIKAALAGYIFNENVRVRGAIESRGETKFIELSHFEVLMKAANIYLSAMNMQNKIWGLYDVPAEPQDNRQVNVKNVSIHMVQALQKIAKKENLALPGVSSDTQTTDNGAPNPDS